MLEAASCIRGGEKTSACGAGRVGAASSRLQVCRCAWIGSIKFPPHLPRGCVSSRLWRRRRRRQEEEEESSAVNCAFVSVRDREVPVGGRRSPPASEMCGAPVHRGASSPLCVCVSSPPCVPGRAQDGLLSSHLLSDGFLCKRFLLLSRLRARHTDGKLLATNQRQPPLYRVILLTDDDEVTRE
ncbi:unnamed protein product [Pleuronectes platessa]|uniref:Uncharacterized protein n=1 Tax=Pleuronectes platessa TaxID=8262 RepID=A0A9N7VJY7_PLEPL|nr:unnamed protein product [Pleuronectes platessa]